MDIVDNDSDQINNPFCIRCNWANAGYNQPNVVTLDFIYTLPKVKGVARPTHPAAGVQWMGSQQHDPGPIRYAVPDITRTET